MRPFFHYAPAANWLSDPNGLVHHAGLWHLHYQYNPRGEEWGHMAWGHAVSANLADWEEWPVALAEDARHMIFSGSATVDAEGRAGFGQGALVAAYTGAERGPGARQQQCLAGSSDGGRTWTKLAGNPVLCEDLADFRDPYVLRDERRARWIMVVARSSENVAAIYASEDLRGWHELSRIDGVGAPGHLWECPMLVELPIEGEDAARWLFKIDVLDGAPGSGALGVTGDFDGERFVVDRDCDGRPAWQVLDRGRDFYAAIAWSSPRDDSGRPAWIGWMGNHAYQGKLPLQGWRGAMSMPRRLSLRRRDDGSLGVAQAIEPALADRFARAESWRLTPAPMMLAPGFRLDFAIAEQAQVVSIESEAGAALQLVAEGGASSLVRRDPALPCFDAVCPLPLVPGQAVSLWVDNGSIELLSADGLVAATLQHRMAGPSFRLRASAPVAARVATWPAGQAVSRRTSVGVMTSAGASSPAMRANSA